VTTIAYRDGVLAADTLTSSNGILCTQAVKIGGRNGVLWSACGDVAWGKRFRDWCASGAVGDHPPLPNDQTGGTIYAPNGDLIVFHSMGIEVRPGLPFWADGSGCDYALGAMQMGATAEQAVAVAMIWDQCTGGQIRTIRR